jgi:hypothetical protein
MTIWGWDASHFDGLLSAGILARAKSEGIAFFTHKIAEGLQDTEGSNDDTALAAARSAGIEFVGGYLIPRDGPTVDAQVTEWIRLADAGEPWWRTFPGWWWQIDLERWPYDSVPASVGIAAGQLLRARTGRQVVLYASRGMYGDQLGVWDGPLWNADYVSHAVGSPAQMYPGDAWSPGWAPYSGQTPALLQFTSSATIAGLTTCDANAFRGSVDQLRALLTHPNGANMTTPLTPAEDSELLNVYAATFYGGDSCGPAVPDPQKNSQHGNAIIDLLQHNRAILDRLAAGEFNQPAVLTDAQLAALVPQIVSGVIAGHPVLTDADALVIEAAVRTVLHGA